MVAWNPAGRDGRTRSAIIVCLALVVLVFIVYLQARNHAFLSFDDNVYVTSNHHVSRGITGTGILWAFTSFHASNWHPITWMSHMVDAYLFGMDPRGHHFTSVAIHALSTVVLFLFLFRVTGLLWRSAFVAALFAIHPMHVESVAWVAERKDVLSAQFWLLTLLLYAVYAETRRPLPYLLALGSFALGLMAKPMLVTLPLVMLLMDLWPLGRLTAGETRMALVKEKLPFLACSLLSSVVTVFAQHAGGAIRGLDAVPFTQRVQNALVTYVTYLGNLIWPDDLAVLYPFPPSLPLWQVAGSALLLLGVSVAVVRVRQRCPYLTAGWFWYLVTLVPVIGIVQVGVQSMADRYTYLPSIGLFIMVAWGVPDALVGLRWRAVILTLVAGAVIVAKSAVTWQQLGYWRDDISLYRRTLQVTENNYVMHNNLGNALAKQWDMDGAVREFREALRINPRYGDAHYNLGMALAMRGELDGAIGELREALRINPGNAKASFNLGLVLDQKRWQQENR